MTTEEIIEKSRKETAEHIKVLQAFVDGKAIEERRISFDHTEWVDNNNPEWRWDKFDYRIKPESKYRPFNNARECWEEMQKHQPFGWISNGELLFNIISIGEGITIHNSISNCGYSFKSAVSLTFADGTPFGIVEEN